MKKHMKKFIESSSGTTELVGHALLIGIAGAAIAVIVSMGMPAIEDFKSTAQNQKVEQSFTVFDSRVSKATLGESPLQVLEFDLGGGSVSVMENSTTYPSYIIIRRINESDILVPMGAVRYVLNSRVIGYEGGGVWSEYPNGNSLMLSPPEMHYNGETLTLPAITVRGNSSAGGKGSSAIRVSSAGDPVILYPNTTEINIGGKWIRNRTNPIPLAAGEVTLIIKSEFYKGWADFARRLIYTRVSTNSTNKTATITLLVVTPSPGRVPITDPQIIRGLNPYNTEPLNNFSYHFENRANKPLNSMDWQLTVIQGTKKLIFHMQKKLGPNEIILNIGYQDTSKPGDNAETWQWNAAQSGFPIMGSGANEYFDIDLLNTSNTLEYSDVTVGATTPCTGKIVGSTRNDTAFTWSGVTTGYNLPIANVTQHYMQLMAPNIDLDNCAPASDPVDYSTSTVNLGYDTAGGITFLHVTQNPMNFSVV
ncbi:MAG TPA: hypothetical protein HA257_01240 [Candidatus Methanoperedenaceae archaeon]|nr:hypothetical protein [Candidatus Methanoperedenaceae archaeon]